ncbi:N-terminal phage integrase SAM-like domain-containing protein [Bacillus sp. JJ722]|uniref:N-terminal phage integrase SAM-like domain-containing protein n=1 Tax=Bacillus sp. JJ722 TaxID=3122973 RepID=UPI002FFEA8B6
MHILIDVIQKCNEKPGENHITKKEAQIAATKEEKNLAEGFEQTDLTLETFLYEWLTEYKKGTIRKNTFILHERNIKKHIAPYFKKILIPKVKPIMHQKFLNFLSEQGYSKRTT